MNAVVILMNRSSFLRTRYPSTVVILMNAVVILMNRFVILTNALVILFRVIVSLDSVRVFTMKESVSAESFGFIPIPGPSASVVVVARESASNDDKSSGYSDGLSLILTYLGSLSSLCMNRIIILHEFYHHFA